MRQFVLSVLFCLPMGYVSGQTFGLGEESPIEVVVTDQIESTFGLGETLAASAVAIGEKTPKPSDSHASTVSVARSVPFRIVSSKTVEAPYKSPPGYHRHVMADGSVIEHHDSNYGDPVAHAGVVGRNWPKYNGPVAPGNVAGTKSVWVQSPQTRTIQMSNCPGGVCPTNTYAPVRRGLFFRR
jgi:hypothetical protein